MTYEDWTSSPDGGWAGNVHCAAYADGRTFFAYADGDGNIEVRYEQDGVVSDPTVLLTGQASDPHDGPSVIVRNDGVVVWALAPHLSTKMYIGIGDAPGSISSFTTTDIQPTLSGTSMTYADLHKATNGDLYLIYRDAVSGASRMKLSKSTNGGVTWSSPTFLFYDPGEFPYWASECNGARIDIGTTDGDSAVYHFYIDLSDDSRHKSDGTTISASLPLVPANLTLVGSTSDLARVVSSVSCDGPAVAWATRTVSGATPGDYKLSTYADGWTTVTIATTGAAVSSHFSEGDVAIATPQQCYVSRYAEGAWNMYRYQGTVGEVVGGGAGPEIHPIKVRGADRVVWMNGDVLPSPGYDIMAGIRADRVRPWTASSVAGVPSAWPSLKP